MDKQMSIQIHIAEYEHLTTEIRQRLHTQHSLFVTCVAAIGILIGTAITANNAEIVLAISYIQSAALLEWSNQDRQLWTIAKYISEWLCPRMKEITDNNMLLEWAHHNSPYRRIIRFQFIVHAMLHILFFHGSIIIGLFISRYSSFIGVGNKHTDGFYSLWWIAVVISIVSTVIALPLYWKDRNLL